MAPFWPQQASQARRDGHTIVTKQRNRRARERARRTIVAMLHPRLPPDIEVMPGTDVEGEWERFKVFEALHHRMRICNPMSRTDVSQLADLLQPKDGEKVLDIACGHGELLIQLAERAPVHATGVDLSPWVLVRAHAEAAQRVPSARIRWVLGNAQDVPEDRYDIVTCVGASWIWHGFSGTATALVDRLADGGRIGVGDLRLRDGVALDDVVETYGRVLTADEQEAALVDLGLEVLGKLDPGDASWNAYQERIDASARAWRDAHPGEEAERFLAEQARWRVDHDRDMGFLAWTVWIARRA